MIDKMKRWSETTGRQWMLLLGCLSIGVALQRALVCTVLAAGINAGQIPLQWVPGSVDLMMEFQCAKTGSVDLCAQFQREVFFATRVLDSWHAFQKWAGEERVRAFDSVLVASRVVKEEVAVLGIVKGRFEDGAALSGTLPGDGREYHGYRIHEVEEADTKGGFSLARLDAGHLVFGDPGLVAQAIDLHRGASMDSVLEDRRMRSVWNSNPSASPVWGGYRATWLNGEAAEAARGRGWGAARSNLEAVTFRADITSEIDFRMQAQTQDKGDLFWLEDGLRTLVSDGREGASGPKEVVDVLRGARIERAENAVQVALTVTAPAMARINKNSFSSSLFRLRLAGAERETRERSWEILQQLEVQPGSRVADIGAGGGYYTLLLGHAVGRQGRVYAVDVDTRALERLRRRVDSAGLTQVETVRGDTDNPNLPPEGIDAALIVNAYHEMKSYEPMLKHIRQALRPGGLLLLLEPYHAGARGETREKQAKDHEIAPEIVQADLLQAGFEIVHRDDEFARSGSRTTNGLILARRPQ